MLDNANLDITIEIPNSLVVLDFVVGGSLENIIIYCSNYIYLEVVKPPDENQCFFIGETNIKLITKQEERRKLFEKKDLCNYGDDKTSPIFYIQCDGCISIEILCYTLKWKINKSELYEVNSTNN